MRVSQWLTWGQRATVAGRSGPGSEGGFKIPAMPALGGA